MVFELAINEGAAEVDHDALPIGTFGWGRPFSPSTLYPVPIWIGIYRKSTS